MLSPRWHKVVRDLWLNKTRTVLVVLSIAVGVFAIGAISISQEALGKDLHQAYMAINPSSAMIMTDDPFDDDLVEAVRRMREIRAAEGRRNAFMRIQVGPEEWSDIQVFGIPDYKDIRINKVQPESGAWPPPLHQVLLERSSLGLAKAQVGDAITVKTPGGKLRELRVAGTTHDVSRMPAMFDGSIYAYVTFDTMEWLGEERSYNEMHFIVAGNAMDKKHVEGVALKVRNKIEGSGRAILFTLIYDPGKHPMQDTINTMLLLLRILGALALVLSGFLVVNTISSVLAQQVRQVGIMKAIGAQRRQIAGLYLTMVLIFGVLSLFVAVPLGALGAWQFTSFMAGLFNFDVESFGVPLNALLLQAAVAMIVPVLAALYPVLNGTRVTAREAMSDYGLGKGQFGRGRIDRLLERVHGVSGPVLLSLRNTFRRKGRLALTLTTLTLAGSIFIAVFTVQASLMLTLDDLFRVWNYDIWVRLSRPYRLDRLESEALAAPGVVAAEGTGLANARRLRPNDTESDNLFLLAPQPGTDLISPMIAQGRWLVPEDENAIVLTSAFINNEPDLKVGSEMTLKINGKKTNWRIVGISQWIAPFAYVNYPYFTTVAGDAGRASSLWVVTQGHDVASEVVTARALERRFDELGVRVASVTKMAEERVENEAMFNIIVVLLLIMAVLLAVVGGLGLMGTMSINVLERTREIGVMRAIGASDRSVVQVFMIEGVLIGLLSWFIGAALALPMSKLLSDAVGYAFMQAPLSYTFSVNGVVLWFLVVVILSGLASFLPARGASRLTVREVLAYE
jgi:putative ABC transport system permease protein